MFNSRDIEKIELIGIRAYIAMKYLRLFIPEYYIASSIADFENNKGEIKTTRKFIPTSDAYLFYNRAVVQFPAAAYEAIEEDFGILSDPTSKLEVSLDILMKDLREDIGGRPRLTNPHILYDPKEDLSFLISYEREMPEGEVQKESAKGVHYRLGFSTGF